MSETLSKKIIFQDKEYLFEYYSGEAYGTKFWSIGIDERFEIVKRIHEDKRNWSGILTELFSCVDVDELLLCVEITRNFDDLFKQLTPPSGDKNE